MISIEKVISLIQKDVNINYVAIITTPWHLLGLKIFLKNYSHSMDRSKGLILISKHKISGICLDIEEVKNQLQINRYIYEYSGEEIRINKMISIFYCYHKKANREIILVSPEKPWIRFGILLETKDINCSYYIFDEGIGTYLRSDKRYYSGIDRVKTFIRKCLLQFVKMNRDISNNNLLVKNGHKYVLQSQIVQQYKEILSIDNEVGKKVFKYNLSDKCAPYVILNTQTYHDNHEILNDADIPLYRIIIKLFHDQGYSVYLKIHPREKSILRYNSLHVKIIDSKITQEELINNTNNKPHYVIGFTTTTLVTLSLFYDIKTISLIKLLDSSYLSGNAIQDFRTFNKIFDDIVLIPDTLEKVKDIIKKEERL